MRSLLLITVCLLSLEWTSAAPRPGPTLDIKGLGSVLGIYGQSTINKRTYSAFLGIRYAWSPSGSNRFQPPIMYEQPWDGVNVTQRAGQKCPQTGFVREQTRDPRNWHSIIEERMREEGTLEEMVLKDKEDCLFIHIYTPNVTASLPVMVFFHGGAFAGGSANVYGGARFMDKDVVLVVPHYRLGPLSFLSLQTDQIAGNAGLLDQILALKWVQKYISNFGGNPNQVTIFGESAGAASVSYLMISPLSQGLFQRVIAESGSALADWAIDLEPEHNTINIARIAGCNQTIGGAPDIQGITDCLMEVDAMKLTRAYQTYKGQEEKEGRTGFGGCSPIIQKAGKERYIEKHPEIYLKNGLYTKVPIMFGSNRDEGTYVLAIVYNGYLVPNKLVNDSNFLNYKMTDVALSLFNTKDPNYWLVDAIEEHYEPHEVRGDFYKMMPALIDTLGAAFLKGPTYRVVQYNSLSSDSYHYTFNYKGSSSLWNMIGDPHAPFKGGICHSNELIYIFDIPLNDLKTDMDRYVSKRMVEIWTNFATYGNPTPTDVPVDGVPTWPKYSLEDKPFLQIMENFTIEHDFTKQYTIDVDQGMTDA